MAQQIKTTSELLKEGWHLGLRRLALPVRMLMKLSKATLAILTLCFLLLSLTLPVLTTLSSVTFATVSLVAEALTSMPSVLKRQSKSVAEVLTEKEAARAKAFVEAEKATARAAKAEGQVENYSARLAAKESALATEKTARAEADLAAKAAATRASQYEGKSVGLELRVAKLETEVVIKAEEAAIYRGERKLLSEAVSDTSSRVAGRVARTLKADVASMAGQAIPYIGVAAIVGSIGYDAYQSCEMVKELHDLDVAFNPDHAIVDTAEVCGTRIPTADEIWNQVVNAPGAALGAAKDALPVFEWEKGWKDLTGHVPSADDLNGIASRVAATLGGWLPDFYWKDGWDDLTSGLGLGAAP